MKDEEELIGLIARIIGYLRDHNRNCYTVEELASKAGIIRDVEVKQGMLEKICEALSREGLLEPQTVEGRRCYRYHR
ncbi:hypothetical protein ACFLTJ_00360 [Chloroflexota bacterium]